MGVVAVFKLNFEASALRQHAHVFRFLCGVGIGCLVCLRPLCATFTEILEQTDMPVTSKVSGFSLREQSLLVFTLVSTKCPLYSMHAFRHNPL